MLPSECDDRDELSVRVAYDHNIRSRCSRRLVALEEDSEPIGFASALRCALLTSDYRESNQV